MQDVAESTAGGEAVEGEGRRAPDWLRDVSAAVPVSSLAEREQDGREEEEAAEGPGRVEQHHRPGRDGEGDGDTVRCVCVGVGVGGTVCGGGGGWYVCV